MISPKASSQTSDVQYLPRPQSPDVAPIVQTRQGAVRGSVADGIYTFKGLPYAAPPFGRNRLRPPQPVEPWNGIRDALAFGPMAPQPTYPPQVAVLLCEFPTPAGEDCLTLNVWSRDLVGAAAGDGLDPRRHVRVPRDGRVALV
jgi:hypothetical protein